MSDRLLIELVKEIAEKWAQHRTCLIHADEPSTITINNGDWRLIRKTSPEKIIIGATVPKTGTKYIMGSAYGGWQKIHPAKKEVPDFSRTPMYWEYEAYSRFQHFDQLLIENVQGNTDPSAAEIKDMKMAKILMEGLFPKKILKQAGLENFIDERFKLPNRKDLGIAANYLERKRSLRALKERSLPWRKLNFERPDYIEEEIKNSKDLTEYEKCIMERLEEHLNFYESSLDGELGSLIKFSSSITPFNCDKSLFFKGLYPNHLIDEITSLEKKLKNAEINTGKYITSLEMTFETRMYVNPKEKMIDIFRDKKYNTRDYRQTTQSLFKENGLTKDDLKIDEEGKKYFLVETWQCQGKGILPIKVAIV